MILVTGDLPGDLSGAAAHVPEAVGAHDKKEVTDSATRHGDEDEGMMTSIAHRTVAVGDRWKRSLTHQRIRNWRLCPDSIDKVDRLSLFTTHVATGGI